MGLLLAVGVRSGWVLVACPGRGALRRGRVARRLRLLRPCRRVPPALLLQVTLGEAELLLVLLPLMLLLELSIVLLLLLLRLCSGTAGRGGAVMPVRSVCMQAAGDGRLGICREGGRGEGGQMGLPSPRPSTPQLPLTTVPCTTARCICWLVPAPGCGGTARSLPLSDLVVEVVELVDAEARAPANAA